MSEGERDREKEDREFLNSTVGLAGVAGTLSADLYKVLLQRKRSRGEDGVTRRF